MKFNPKFNLAVETDVTDPNVTEKSKCILKQPQPIFGIYWPIEIYKQLENKACSLFQPTNLMKSGIKPANVNLVKSAMNISDLICLCVIEKSTSIPSCTDNLPVERINFRLPGHLFACE